MMQLAIVLDGDQRSALATVRALGIYGVPIMVADSHLHTLAGSSKYCSKQLQYPDPTTAPKQFDDWLAEINNQYPNAVLLPMTDITVPRVLMMSAQLTQLRIGLPELSAYETLSNKYDLFLLAKNKGVRVPQTIVVDRNTATAIQTETLHYPVVLKPRQSIMQLNGRAVKRSTTYAANSAELKRKIDELLLDDHDELLIQEYITGFGAGVFALYNHGQPLLFFGHRRLREKPPTGGVSVLCESMTPSPASVEAAKRLLESVQWHGAAMIEFKIDEAGTPWLIEVNGRFWGSLQLAIDSGANFPVFVYEMARGNTPSIPSFTAGRKLRWWLGDLDNLYLSLRDHEITPTYWNKLQACARFLLPWTPGQRYEFFRWHDLRPAWHAFKQYFGQLS